MHLIQLEFGKNYVIIIVGIKELIEYFLIKSNVKMKTNIRIFIDIEWIIILMCKLMMNPCTDKNL